jgi:hypothetical protein
MSIANTSILSQQAAQNNYVVPQTMLRLVRLAMPNLVRNKIFAEYAMTDITDMSEEKTFEKINSEYYN